VELDGDDPIEDLLKDQCESGVYRGENQLLFEEWLKQTNEALNQSGPRCDICVALSNDLPAMNALRDLDLQEDDLRPPFVFQRIDEYFANHFAAEKRLMLQRDMSQNQVDVLSDPCSKRRKKVEGQLAKSKKEPQRTIDDLIGSYKAKVESAEAQLEELRKARARSKRGKLLAKARKLTAKYKEEWYTTDAAMGEESGENGRKLESRCDEIVSIVSQRADIVADRVWSNCDWNDGLGEVDIVIQACTGEFILVEVKSRVYDVMAGWLQSGSKRHPRKTSLKLPDNPIPVHIPRNVRCFVVTVLPPNPYVLKCEVRQRERKAVDLCTYSQNKY